VSPKGFQLPVTQDVVAHALGLSLVHLSRTLRQMRNEGAIALQPGRVQLLKPDILAAAANFPHTASWSEAG
jgi:CRP-like cAMP-binding protein